MSWVRLLRVGTALALGSTLLLQPGTAVFAEGGGAVDLSNMDPKLRAHVSGLVDLALTTDTTSPTRAAQQTSVFAGNDECFRHQRSDAALPTGPENVQTFEGRMIADVIRCFPVCNLPHERTFIQIDRRDSPVGWLDER